MEDQDSAAAREPYFDANEAEEGDEEVVETVFDEADNKRLVVGRNIRFGANVTGCDLIHIAGTVEADFAGRHLVVEETGSFKGKATVESADIRGRAEGEITVSGKLLVQAGGELGGIIVYGSIELEDGAIINGTIAQQGS